jgi:putative transposase
MPYNGREYRHIQRISELSPTNITPLPHYNMKYNQPDTFHIYQEVYFTTCTIVGWKHLLKPDKYKQIIADSLRFMVENKRAVVYAFVIMPNHIHIVWHILEGFTIDQVEQRFLTFTAQKIKFDLQDFHPQVLEVFKSTQSDRAYHFWKREPLSIPIYYQNVLRQKIDYVHANPHKEKWNLIKADETYYWSSESLYLTGETHWDFVTNFWGTISVL